MVSAPTVPGYLLLTDGSRFEGRLLAPGGKPVVGGGEVVFQTGMTGYQEVITDPSYRGQVVTFTAPHIGNTGIVPDDHEALEPALAGVIIRSLTRRPSNWRAEVSLIDYLECHKIPCLTEVDTRALTRRIREGGALMGVFAVESADSEAVRERLRSLKGMVGRDLVSEVVPADPSRRPPNSEEAEALADVFPAETNVGDSLRITVVHAGLKAGIDAMLRRRGAKVTVVGAGNSARSWFENDPHAVVLSNGPGDPAAVPYLVEAARSILGKVPLLGICLGFQVLAQVVGARTQKMSHGHHGINHPVKDLRSGCVLVTSQNHEFEVLAETLPPDAEVTYRSLNDGTCEGFVHEALGITAVQFHPEARGGPHDAGRVMVEFLRGVRDRVR